MRFVARALCVMVLPALAACGSDSNPMAPSGSGGSGGGGSTPPALGAPQLSVQVSFSPPADVPQGFIQMESSQSRGLTVGLTVSNGSNSLPATITDIIALASLMPDLSDPFVNRGLSDFEPFTVGTGQTVMQSYPLRFRATGPDSLLANPNYNPTANYRLTLSYSYDGGSSTATNDGTLDTALTRRPIEACEETEYRLCLSFSQVALKVTVWYGESEPLEDMRATVTQRYSDGGTFMLGGLGSVWVQFQDTCASDGSVWTSAIANSPGPLTLKITNVNFNVTQEFHKPANQPQVQDLFGVDCMLTF